VSWEIVYYSEKEQKSIGKWPIGIRASYARITETIEEFGPNLGLPYTKAMKDGLFEIRAKGKEGIGRAFFCTVVDQKVVILHSIIKKTQKTSKKDLDLAKKRMKEMKK
jgi:phage-related protein